MQSGTPNHEISTIYCLLIEPDTKTVELIKNHFNNWVQDLGVRITHAPDLESAHKALALQSYDLVISDIAFPGIEKSPIQIIRQLKTACGLAAIVAIYEMPDKGIQAELFKAGVVECIDLYSALTQPEVVQYRIINLIRNIHKNKQINHQIDKSTSLLAGILAENHPIPSMDTNQKIQFIADSLETIKENQAQSATRYDQLMKAFSMYVDPKIIENVILGGKLQTMNGTRRDITVLFTDLRGYTRMSAGMDSNQVISFLNEYYTAMTEVVMGYNGIIDKYIGDGIMCIFGAPVPNENHVVDAIEAAIEMQSVFELWQKTWMNNYHIKPGQGIGLACGETVVGNMGSFQKVSYTAIGAAVNLAARLESVAESGDIVISNEMYHRLEESGKNKYNFEALSPIAIRGMDGRHHIYRLTKEIDLDDILVEKE